MQTREETKNSEKTYLLFIMDGLGDTARPSPLLLANFD